MKYYHAVLRKFRAGIMQPAGFYERVEKGGCPEPLYSAGEYIGFPMSNVKESSFSKSVVGAASAVVGGCHLGKDCTVHVYETDEPPDVDISHCTAGDFATLEEVRYQRPVRVRYKGRAVIPRRAVDEFHKRAGYLQEAGLDFNPESWDNLIRYIKRRVRRALR